MTTGKSAVEQKSACLHTKNLFHTTGFVVQESVGEFKQKFSADEAKADENLSHD